MINIDELYKQVGNPNITKDEIVKIIDTIENGTSFDNTYHNELKLFVKIASLPLSDPKLVARMFHVLKLVYTITETDFSRCAQLLDYGSKEEFDKIWYQDTRQHQILDSKWCYGNQLQEFYNTNVISKKSGSKGITLVKTITSRILTNPNCPDDIYMDAIKKMGDYYMPIIITKTSLPERVLAEIKHYISYSDNSGTLFRTFVTMSKLPWKKISEVITFDYFFIADNYHKTIYRLGTTRLPAFEEFCQRDDCPQEVKLKLFEWTNNVNFLPNEARDIFVF